MAARKARKKPHFTMKSWWPTKIEAIVDFGVYPDAETMPADPLPPLPPEPEIELCREWIRLFLRPTTTFRRRWDSYAYKHDVERWSRTLGRTFTTGRRQVTGWNPSHAYVSNGALIEAMRREGYRMVRTDAGSPNAFFNASEVPAPKVRVPRPLIR